MEVTIDRDWKIWELVMMKCGLRVYHENGVKWYDISHFDMKAFENGAEEFRKVKSLPGYAETCVA